MLKLVRSGHKTLVFEVSHLDKAIDFLKTTCNVKNVYNPSPNDVHALNDIFGQASNKHVMVHLVSQMKPILSHEEVDALVKIEGEMFKVLIEVINKDTEKLITSSRVGPGVVIMKLIGDEEKVIDMVKSDFGAVSAPVFVQQADHSDGTIISFTKGNITKPVSVEEMHPLALHTHMNFSTVLQTLRLQNLKYLNAGLHNEDWYELKIKIYDAYGKFELHYKRLAYILEKLDVGLILGESWGTDAATIFLSVGIYKVRFFTFYNPIHIKKILVGLEFLDDGTRVVDYDLYLKRRKIHWDALRDKEHKTREALSHMFRMEILSQLTEEEIGELHQMEKEILATRTMSPD